MARPFSGVLTLAVATTVYNVGALIQAIDAGASTRYAEIRIETPANTDTIKGGNRSNITDTDYGFSLAPSQTGGNAFVAGSGNMLNNLDAKTLWLRAPTTASQKVFFQGRIV